MYIYGINSVIEALKNPNRNHKKLWVTNKNLKLIDAKSVNLKPIVMAHNEITAILREDVNHQGMLLETSMLPHKHIEGIDSGVILILDQITDEQNLGSIIRIAAALSAKAIIIPQDNSAKVSSTVCKVAAGGVEHIDVIAVVNISRAIEELKNKGFWIWGFDEHAKISLNQSVKNGVPEKIGLVFGNEGEGMRSLTKKHCDVLVKIDTSSYFPSLNVSSAVSMGLYGVMFKN